MLYRENNLCWLWKLCEFCGQNSEYCNVKASGTRYHSAVNPECVMIERAGLWKQPLRSLRLQAYNTVRNTIRLTAKLWPTGSRETRVWNCHRLRSRLCQAIGSDENCPTTSLAAMFSEGEFWKQQLMCAAGAALGGRALSLHILSRLVERTLEPPASTHSEAARHISVRCVTVLSLSRLLRRMVRFGECINWNGFRRKRSWLNPCNNPVIWPRELRKITKSCQDSEYFGRSSNRMPSEYKSRALPLR